MRHRLSIATAILLGSLIGLRADAADPRVTHLEPPGAQRGTEVTVRIHGQRLAPDPQDLLLYEPGIELIAVEPSDKFVDAKLRIAADCPVGPHALRLRTKTGLSNLVTLHIGALEEVQEAEPNNQDDQAQEIPTGSVVNGVVQREDVDCFAVLATEGERLSVEVEGIRIGRTFFDPAIEVIGPDGQQVAAADDTLPTHQDPSLSLIAPATGRYLIRIREAAGRGGGDHTYRLHVGGFPRPMAVFPPAVVAREPTELRWLGTAAPAENHKVSLESKSDGAAIVVAEDDHGAAPTGLRVRVAPRPVVNEVEPNNNVKQATSVQLPAALVGVLSKERDTDYFRFSAKKGEVWDFRAVARQLRSPIDPVLYVYDAKGKRLASNDDDRGDPDSYIRFKVPADGEYVVWLRDHQYRGGPTHVYALEATRPEPRVELSIHESRRYVSETINVARGNRCAILVNVKRVDLGGPVDVVAEGLPEGVEVAAPTVAGNYYRTPVVFSASESAKLAGALVAVGGAREQDVTLRSIFRQQTWLVRGRNNIPVWNHFADRAAVAVTERLPFAIELIEPKAPIVQSGSMQLRVVATRDDGFDEPIRVYMLYNPPGVSSNRSRSVAKGKTEALIPVTANPRAHIGDWDIVVIGESRVRGRVTVSSKLVKLRIAAPYFAVSLPKVTVERGESVEYVVGLEPKTAFEGNAKLELIGLPPGVTTAPVEVATDATSAAFQLAVAPDARLGRHRSLTCRTVLTVKGEPVTHTQGGGELLIDPPTIEPAEKRTVKRDAMNPEASS